MKAILKREVKNYLKRPLFWIGMLIIILGVYQDLKPYLGIHYITSEAELEKLSRDYPKAISDADITDGYVPTKEADRRKIWEETIRETLVSEFQMDADGADAVLDEMRGMDVEEACGYLENEYGYYNAIYTYEDTRYHQGTPEEINSYISSQLEQKSFFSCFSRKFADFAGLYMGFFATVMLAALFWQDTRKHTYGLLHTKPVSAGEYVSGKIAGGFCVCLISLAILNLVFGAACAVCAGNSGFEISLADFFYLPAMTAVYILPNMLMAVCVYALVSLLFKNPLPAAPLLILYMVYSNTGRRNAEGVFGYYGRPLAIMVRFPGNFFDTSPPPMAIPNQCFLLAASAVIFCFCVRLWKRRRM